MIPSFLILWSPAMEIVLYHSREGVQLCWYDGIDEMYHLARQGNYLGTFFIDSRWQSEGPMVDSSMRIIVLQRLPKKRGWKRYLDVVCAFRGCSGCVTQWYSVVVGRSFRY